MNISVGFRNTGLMPPAGRSSTSMIWVVKTRQSAVVIASARAIFTMR